MNDLISIIIVNYNGKKWLQACLDSIQNQTYKKFELIFVDNNSNDDSIEFVKNNYGWINVVKNNENSGFAGGNIIGLNYAQGKYIFLLNNDTYLQDDCLEKLIEGFNKIPRAGSIQSKIIMMHDNSRLDGCGSYWTSSSFLYHFGYGQDQSSQKYNQPIQFFSNKGASMMIKKEVIEKVGFFDEDFWSYYEETDLCHRIQIAGYECWYWPNAVAHHAIGGSSLNFDNSFIQFHNFKNKLLSFLKNFQIITLLFVLPTYFFITIILSLFWLISGKFTHFFSIYKSFWWNMVNFNRTRIKRFKIQRLRKKSDREIFEKTKKNPPILYYYYLFVGLEKYGEHH